MEYEAKQPVYLSATDFLELEFHLLETRPGITPSAFVAELVKRWLSAEMARLSVRKDGPSLQGFQWKTVFLPDGTGLRTCHGDKVDFAKVVGNRIVCDDGPIPTPSLFANRHGKGRNAWRFVWLRFPGDNDWIRADHCRERNGDVAPKRAERRLTLRKVV